MFSLLLFIFPLHTRLLFSLTILHAQYIHACNLCKEVSIAPYYVRCEDGEWLLTNNFHRHQAIATSTELKWNFHVYHVNIVALLFHVNKIYKMLAALLLTAGLHGNWFWSVSVNIHILLEGVMLMRMTWGWTH